MQTVNINNKFDYGLVSGKQYCTFNNALRCHPTIVAQSASGIVNQGWKIYRSPKTKGKCIPTISEFIVDIQITKSKCITMHTGIHREIETTLIQRYRLIKNKGKYSSGF